MPKVSLNDDQNKLIISTDFADRYQIKQLPGARFKDGEWRVPLSWAACVILRELFGHELLIADEVYDWARQDERERRWPAVYWRERTSIAGEHQRRADHGLRPFQSAGIRFLAAAGSAFLGETMGSGKTVQVIRALMLLHDSGVQDLWPMVVVCPNSIKLTWLREFEQWWPEIDTAVIDGNIAQRRQILAEEHQVYVVNYEGLRSHSRLAPYGSVRLRRCHVCDPELPDTAENAQHRCEWCPKELNKMVIKTFVVDEAHRIKNPLAKQTRAVWQVGKTAQRRFAMTGTPIGDSPDDMWPILHLLDQYEHPDRGRYVDYFCQAGFNYFGALEILGLHPEHRESFFKIIEPRFRRLPKELILPQLPPVVRSVREITMGTRQERAYRDMERHMAAILDDELLLAPNPLTKLTRLMQFASACGRIEDNNVELIEPSCKIDALHDLLEELGDEPLVVASASKKLAKLTLASLERKGVSCGIISGDQDIYQRRAAEQDFQAGRVRVLVCVVAAAGEGLTLTRARHLVWLMRDWSMIKCEQMENRIHRIGSEQHETVEIIDLITFGTVEYRQRDVLAGKVERLEEIVRDRQVLARLLGV